MPCISFILSTSQILFLFIFLSRCHGKQYHKAILSFPLPDFFPYILNSHYFILSESAYRETRSSSNAFWKMCLQGKCLSHTGYLGFDFYLLAILVLLWFLYEFYYLSACSYITQIPFPNSFHYFFKAHTQSLKKKSYIIQLQLVYAESGS